MNYTRVSVADLRKNLANYIDRARMENKIFEIIKWGRVMGYLVPPKLMNKEWLE